MSRNLINLVVVAVTFGGSALLAQPTGAAASECTLEQWAWAESIINDVCPGGSFTLSCQGNVMHLTLVACAPGNG
jgi:hypothetical protein